MKTSLILLSSLFLSANALAEDYATPKEAEAMVGKAVALIKSAGTEKAYDAFTNDKAWKDRDLYVVVYGLDGVVRAHGQNPKMVGKNLIEMKDPDGKPFVKERVDLTKNKGTFWQDYKFTDPVTKKILPKQMYCQRSGDTAVCAGVYKR